MKHIERWIRVLFVIGILTQFFHSAAAQHLPSTPIEVGFRDFNYDGGDVVSDVTAEKPESKLWFNDNFWWGVLWDPSKENFRIDSFDISNKCWINVGTNVDDRGNSYADVLWDGKKLYI